jgi:pimeloyl-ACP methyl ester carboxylesterase
LGALYADNYPARVRAAVLDGAIDPALPYAESVTGQARGFEHALDRFLEWCARDGDCDLASTDDPRAAYDALQRDIDARPMRARVGDEDRTLGPGELDVAVASALYAGQDRFEELGAALAAAAEGDAEDLVRLADEYTGRGPGGTYDQQTAAQYSIGCLDGPVPRSVRGVERLAAAARAGAPHFGPSTVWLGLPCAYWPARPVSKPAPVTAAGAPPILVVGTTGDPATPYEWAASLAGQLESGNLLTFEGDGHTAYGRDTCVTRAVDDYLLDLEVLPAGARCPD